ncbi:MAG TPA: hypothetical protein GX702_10780 [Chloroflexi bacterium]|jgi:hypothetical protein|nr:hypothetical protein [Chloroflexota bacterium]
MPFEALAAARDWALILLALESMVLAAVPLAVLYFVTKALRRFIPKVRPALRRATAWLRNLHEIVERIMASVCAPFIVGYAAAERVRITARGLGRMLPGRR